MDVSKEGGYADRLVEISRTYSNNEAPDLNVNTSEGSFTKESKPDSSDNSDDSDKLTDQERTAIETVKSTFVNLFTNPPQE